ncbi:MAG TPA: non-canonical purine NTP pyrophosphatase, RdgB/HAM1 family [Balneola sp.]|jgi:XTP/dITP diphosphohydrolase|nr:non-canonical purine NTP pyrophosphatase, RdgB/HAM1 family [Bacteroidota bacterium]MAC06399.1 non-canonical purine NTP pyrophosphatase, RdgB/HAM1 family [Balneola sp.]MAO78592.1 non-canonical purine NTP pyrophosphatase, RdgB/HAM1 family [Balneola sp.]MBF63179.1 non-canonical purine NTP pyrophosphatase, RdgB/HAM1 family [Balneola sp.]HAH51233.1 non-canonical purine NTP pyrophosphatase, RdgB/HAM1 family [Balneola sp.]|tara:strand:- start:3502 stop:4092 length:591 start_codon:yes stop_codon:yes gene_type:complete
MDKLILASRNKNKIEEMKQLVAHLGIDVFSALDFPDLEEVEEDKPTLEGNALKKALYVNQETGIPALSDDTGLEVEALDGAPGVYSARYAGEDATYQDNVMKLLDALKGKENRNAQFRTVVALVDGDQEWTFEGVCKGTIIEEQIGKKGFGYDPIFIPDEFAETFAQMDPNIKNLISHRGKAVQRFLEFLEEEELG